jgi:putative membrane protein
MDLIWWAIWFIILVSFFSFFVPVSRKHAKSSPLDILQRRFSNGEINIHEYEQRKRFLEKDEDLKTKIFFLSRMYKQ